MAGSTGPGLGGRWLATSVGSVGLVVSLVLLHLVLPVAGQATYFVSASLGDDASPGTDASHPLKTLAAASSRLQDHDAVRLRRGDVWHDETLQVDNLTGIHVWDYGNASLHRPVIEHATSFLNLTYCLTFVNCGNITVENLHFGGCSTAIHFLFGANIVRSDFLVQNNYFRDHQVPPDAYNPQSGFWSRTIDFSSMAVATVYNATIQHNAANRIDAFFDTVNVGLVNLVLQANTLHHCGGNCVIVRGENSLVDGNVFSYDQPQRMFLHGTTDIMLGPVHGSTVISNNVFVRRGEYEGSPDGCGIDFEVASVGVQVLNNLFYQPFASGVMIFGHGTTAQNFTLGGNAFVQAGCEAVRGDRAGVVFVCPGGAQPSGQLRDNVFQTCTNGVPAILEGQPNCSSKVLRTNNTVTAQFPLAATPHLEVFAPPMTSTDPTVLMLTNATSSDPLAAIRYTMDGSVPSSSSPLFPNSGLELPWPAEVLTINLRAFSDNRLPSVVGSAILERWAYRP